MIGCMMASRDQRHRRTRKLSSNWLKMAAPPSRGTRFFSRIQDALTHAVTPRLQIDRKTIEKTWKLMDKVVKHC